VKSAWQGAAALGLLIALLDPAPGWAHAVLVRSTPAIRAVLRRAPDRVALWFSERLEPAFARMSVWSADGTQVDLEDAQVTLDEPKKLSVSLRPLSPGTYTVRYRVLSVDGHVVESAFTFTLRTP
jgi:copper resistance protein C